VGPVGGNGDRDVGILCSEGGEEKREATVDVSPGARRQLVLDAA
jgi:hypothetical protein